MVKRLKIKEVAEKYFNGDIGEFCYMDDVTDAINEEIKEARKDLLLKIINKIGVRETLLLFGDFLEIKEEIKSLDK